MAERARVPVPVWQQLLSRLGLLALVVSLAGLGLLLLFPRSLRLWLSPPPVEGLDARTTADGRLLGHFPYGEASPETLVEVAPGQALHRDAAQALLGMQRAAAADGVQLVLLSAFRPVALQKELFFDVKSERNQSARERAQVSAPPGFSEHSTGYAVDLGDALAPQSHLSVSFERTAAFAWLEANAARHHFILSFPPGNAQGVSYEPWHWRFEGSADALQLFEAAHRLERD
ncbi:D-alanyl-D-alanine carboxypeptidase family protein [Cyanobium sp. CH-040]|uniref:M15 family metallopeptidase n=1 Tax=Cyanobium sp. CH-040 TaxID=2823708 RepID=UPI0020CE46D7|nr:M15 family metallopeptidase [Cyanobium sp. CH-040]